MISVPNDVCAKQNHVNQQLEDYKPACSCSYEMLQSLLAGQAKLLLQGNKNKTGFFDEGSANMEEQETDNLSTLCKEVDGNQTLSNVVQTMLFLYSLTCIKESCLDTYVIYTLEGNKNGIGALDGSKCHVRDQF